MKYPHVNEQEREAESAARNIDAAYRLLPPVLLMTVLVPAPLAWLLLRGDAPWMMPLWVAAHMAVSGIRYLDYRRFLASADRRVHLAQWSRHFILGFAVTGFLWSLMGTVLYPTADGWEQKVLSFVVAGVATVALLSTGPMDAAYRYFVLSFLLPIAAWKFRLGGVEEISMAVLSLFYAVAMIVISKRASALSRATLRAQIESEHLGEQLARSIAETNDKREALHSEIAARSRAQEQERSAATRLHLALESAGMQTWEFDVTSRTLLITGKAGHDLDGNESAPDETSEFFAHVHPDDRASVDETVDAVRAPGDVFSCEFRLDVGGAWRWMSARGCVVAADDGRFRMIGVTQDINRRRDAQNELIRAKDGAESASRAKSQFLANMSHEIRTPLNGVVGMLELLAESDLSEHQLRMAHAATRSSEALLAVINNILDLSKIEANRLELEAVPFDVARLAEDVSSLVSETATRKGLVLACRIDDDIPRTVVGDPHRVRQVMLNLIANAVKFTERGEVVVELCRAAWAGVNEDARTVRLRLAVRDTGIGLSSEEIGRLFHAFSQADMSTSRRFGGTGLGLAISRQLVELMGGAITVESTPGAGATFAFELELPIAADALAEQIAPAALAGRSALIVEDNPTNRAILQAQCECLGLSSEVVCDGHDALTALRAASTRGAPFDVALLDMHMPGMSGLDLARLMAADPVLATTRMIMLTSGCAMGDLAAGRGAGVWASLSKPVRRDELLEVIRTALGAPVARVGSIATSGVASERAARAHVLVVEDNEVNRQVASAMLHRLHCEVTLADGGAAGAAAALRGGFDLILMDCQMPLVDGFEATRRIREQQLSSRRTPIVALTANALQGDRERCMAAGMDDYLTKPFSRVGLSAMLDRWVPAADDAGRAPEAASGSAPDGAVIDDLVLADVQAMDTDGTLMSGIIALYQQDGAKLVVAIRAAQEGGDVAALAFAAHTLKSSSGCVGARHVMAMCAQFETRARTTKHLCSNADVIELEAAFYAACTALAWYLQPSASV